MLSLRSEREFLERPEGAFVAGERWIYFCLDPALLGFKLFGRPTRDDMQTLMVLWEREFSRPPHRILADVAGVEVMPPPVFEVLTSFFAQHEAQLSRSVTRCVIVRASGFNGALASGFFSAAPLPFEVEFCHDRVEALARLGSEAPSAHARALEEAQAQIERVPQPLRALRQHLEANPARATLEGAAAALGVSVRSLQRLLSSLRTSYRAEVQAARVRRAEQLLLETEEALTRIAIEVGCGSSQRFSALFKAHRGVTPSEYRARRAARDGAGAV